MNTKKDIYMLTNLAHDESSLFTESDIKIMINALHQVKIKYLLNCDELASDDAITNQIVCERLTGIMNKLEALKESEDY